MAFVALWQTTLFIIVHKQMAKNLLKVLDRMLKQEPKLKDNINTLNMINMPTDSYNMTKESDI